jgi:diguanylate cyclase
MKKDQTTFPPIQPGPHNPEFWHALGEDIPVSLAAQLQRSQLQLEALKEALAVSEQETAIARQKIEALSGKGTTAQVADHDELTGLPNRRLLLDRLKQAIALAVRQGKRVALLFLHVDEFTIIHNNLGQTAADDLLRALAQRLQACLRDADSAYRCGVDEFIVMLPGVDGHDGAATVEQKIRTQCAAPYVINGNTIDIALSMGSAVYPVDKEDSRELKQTNVLILPRQGERRNWRKRKT